LLQKEREERDTDENFTKQKEEIIAKARELDTQRQKYKEEQQKMINDVTEKTFILQQNSLKRKNEEEKLAKEKAEIEKKKRDIEELQRRLHEKERLLQDKEEDL